MIFMESRCLSMMGLIGEDYPNPTLAQQEFYDNLMYILEQDPDVVFSVGDLELYDEDTQEWFDQQVKDYMKENNITY